VGEGLPVRCRVGARDGRGRVGWGWMGGEGGQRDGGRGWQKVDVEIMPAISACD
jgi:hypothetical protein